jgi:hypothetical protein
VWTHIGGHRVIPFLLYSYNSFVVPEIGYASTNPIFRDFGPCTPSRTLLCLCGPEQTHRHRQNVKNEGHWYGQDGFGYISRMYEVTDLRSTLRFESSPPPPRAPRRQNEVKLTGDGKEPEVFLTKRRAHFVDPLDPSDPCARRRDATRRSSGRALRRASGARAEKYSQYPGTSMSRSTRSSNFKLQTWTL